MSAPVQQLRRQLMDVAVSTDAAPMAAYMKQVAPFLGVKAVVRRQVVRQWWAELALGSAQDVVTVAQQLIAEPEREFHYAAADTCAYGLRWLDADFVAQSAASFLCHVPWWDTVDLWGSDVINPLCVRFDNTTTLWRWNASDNRWLIRASIQHQRGRKSAYDVDLVLAMCAPHVANPEFFVAKAIGWALRDMAKWYPTPIRQFVESHPQLSTVARTEALRGLQR